MKSKLFFGQPAGLIASVSRSFLVAGIAAFTALTVESAPTNAILFVTQVPMPTEINSRTITQCTVNVSSPFGNHLGDTAACGRGGALWIRYGDGTVANLTQLAGYGSTNGFQGTNGIAVREPAVHWSGTKALFSMVVGAPVGPTDTTRFVWQIYEITNFAQGQVPIITKINNQPANFNNVSPAYGTDGRIIFASDRPRDGSTYLYPLREEYLQQPTVTGLWSLDPARTNDLFLLEHSPSGSFRPLIDSFGRVIFTRWDHLARDVEAVSDRNGLSTNNVFNYSDETAGALVTTNTTEIFPEPRPSDTNALVGLNMRGNAFNQFFPWSINEDGTGEEVINHIGRQELLSQIPSSTFTNDPNIVTLTASQRFNTNYVANFFPAREDPNNPGLLYGVDCLDIGTHGAGQIVTLTAGTNVNADVMRIGYITAKATAFPNPNGLYRNPLPLSNGVLVAVYAARATNTDINVGTAASPASFYDFRLRTMKPNAGLFTADLFLTQGFTNNLSYFVGVNTITYNGPMWELDPVEVTARPIPPRQPTTVAPIEAQVFTDMNVDLPTFQGYLRTNGYALVVGRNVTARDRADKQQPYNLKVAWSDTQTLGTNGSVYSLGYMQLIQADQLRGFKPDGVHPAPGRRVLGQPWHDSVDDNPPVVGGPAGSVQLGNDGSFAAIVPARRAMSWQSVDTNGMPIVRERYWLTFQPGEVRSCANCHGINTLDQAGHVAPTNKPEALKTLLQWWKVVNLPQTPGVIVFQSARDGNQEIYSMNPDGSNPKNLTQTNATDAICRVSYDGKKVVFMSDRAHVGNMDIWTMNSDGTGLFNVSRTNLSGATIWAASPNFDASKIVYMGPRNGPGGYDIYTCNADGSGVTNLTASWGDGDFPYWSYDGSKIVFGSSRDNTTNNTGEEVYIMNANGSGIKRLTFSNGRDFYPVITPNGSKVAFTSERDGHRQIYVMNAADGTGLTNISNNAFNDQNAYYSPDGSRISFTSDRNGAAEVYVMNADGSGQTRLTSNSVLEAYPSWGNIPPAGQPPPQQFTLTVANGLGSGSYTNGAVIAITANSPPAGQVFDRWTGANVANAFVASTTLIMPASNTTVTATYKTVSSGAYDVGPGWPYSTLGSVPWMSLQPGNIVNIHYKAGGYHEIVLLSNSGTPTNHIVIRGIADPQTGLLPTIDGQNAITAPGTPFRASIFNILGAIVVSRANGTAYGYIPSYIDIENLHVQNANQLYTLTDVNGVVTNYHPFATAIYVENAQHLAVRNCELNGSGNGFFVNSKDGVAEELSADVLVERCYIHHNGNPGSYSEHNIYTECNGIIFQYNIIGPIASGSNGEQIKDRSAGTVIRYNKIIQDNGPGHAIWILQPQGGLGQIDVQPTYPTTYIYGNIIYGGPQGGLVMVRYDAGGDMQHARKGPHYFYNNTLINQADQSTKYYISALMTPTHSEIAGLGWNEVVDARNNLFVNLPKTTGATATDFALLGSDDGILNLGVNWISPGFRPYRLPYQVTNFVGQINGQANLIVGDAQGQNNPHFVDLANGNYNLGSGANAIDAAGPLASAVLPTYDVTREYLEPHSGTNRVTLGSAPDLGAFESNGAPPPPLFTLTVNNGSGSGSYTNGAIVLITANAPPTGQIFDRWYGALVADAFASSTTLTMPGSNTTVTATYKSAPPPTFTLTVGNGTGSGTYAAGTVVSISANSPPSGKVFDRWTGATVSNALAPTTTLIMPASNTSVTATYKAPSLVITTASPLPKGTVGVNYAQSLMATGGTPPYAWSLIAGNLPGGMMLSAPGQLGGTPTASGLFPFGVRVADSVNVTTNQSFSLTIEPAPSGLVFSPTNGPIGTVVTISGANLGGATNVQFNGTRAVFMMDSDSQLTAIVPQGASSGPISVTTTSATQTSVASFVVTPGMEYPSVFVADTSNNRLQKSADGMHWTKLGLGLGSGQGQFNHPEAVTASGDGQILYVADRNNYRIQKSVNGGAGWTTFAASNTVHAPQGVALALNGDLYVSDTVSNRVLRFAGGNPNAMTILASAGNLSGSTTQVKSPRGLAIDLNNTLYIADCGNNRVLRVNHADVSNASIVVARKGTNAAPGQVQAPQGVGADNDGNLYVADTGNSRILFFPLGAAGSATVLACSNEVSAVEGVTVSMFATGAFAGQSALIVSDTGHNRVIGKTNPDQPGAFVVLGTNGTAVGQFRGPSKVR